MFNGSNCDRKSQLSGILTEPLNPPDVRDNDPLLVNFMWLNLSVNFEERGNGNRFRQT